MASAASAGPPGGPPPPPGSLIPEGGAEYYIVRLTAYGNAALRELCRTPEQREVWSWPSYEFLVKMKKDRTLVISADQTDPQCTAVASAPLPPPSRVKELTDSDEANDDNGASGTATAV
ncbi:hypothetical protein N7447_004692 [Penicillium robsamsonii]|uniref:uncharacterized protein n=1 Tax=Penicillium robsamsonii TaxID=1792511 RepID=UPI002548F7CE|nr:uncharacterized protein N7447_004692 [Penicillium robsamsonii]KAJ5822352.1 hypothetical protein N7447_004692 [Penicillium robsamsonii]